MYLLPLKELKDEPLLGGFMLWDGSFDQNNIMRGKHFREHTREMYGNKGPLPTGNPKTLPPNLNTKTPIVTKKPNITKKPLATKRPELPTRPSKSKP